MNKKNSNTSHFRQEKILNRPTSFSVILRFEFHCFINNVTSIPTVQITTFKIIE